MSEEPPYRVDVEGITDTDNETVTGSELRGRPWVGIRFDCCGAYTRAYRNREGTAYRARCPRCTREVTLRVGPDGTDARFFVAQ